MKYLKSVGILLAIIVIGAGAVITSQSIKNEQRQEASVYVAQTAKTQFGGSVQIGNNGLPHLGGLPLCQVNTQSVTVTSPGLAQVYVSGQNLVVNWSTCGIAASATGTLTVTNVSGSGPTFSSVVITGSTSSHTFIIPAMTGIFDGTDGSVSFGTYVAKVTYGTISGSSNNFQIEYSKTGVRIVNGSNYADGSSMSSGTDIYLKAGGFPLSALGHDIYLDKDVVANAPAGTLGSQIVTLKEYLANPDYSTGAEVPFDAQVIEAPTLVPLTPGVVLLPGGTYKIPAGTQAQFDIEAHFRIPTAAISPYVRWINMEWTGYGFSTSDMNGTLAEPVYEINVGSWGNFNI